MASKVLPEWLTKMDTNTRDKYDERLQAAIEVARHKWALDTIAAGEMFTTQLPFKNKKVQLAKMILKLAYENIVDGVTLSMERPLTARLSATTWTFFPEHNMKKYFVPHLISILASKYTVSFNSFLNVLIAATTKNIPEIKLEQERLANAKLKGTKVMLKELLNKGVYKDMKIVYNPATSQMHPTEYPHGITALDKANHAKYVAMLENVEMKQMLLKLFKKVDTKSTDKKDDEASEKALHAVIHYITYSILNGESEEAKEFDTAIADDVGLSNEGSSMPPDLRSEIPDESIIKIDSITSMGGALQQMDDDSSSYYSSDSENLFPVLGGLFRADYDSSDSDTSSSVSETDEEQDFGGLLRVADDVSSESSSSSAEYGGLFRSGYYVSKSDDSDDDSSGSDSDDSASRGGTSRGDAVLRQIKMDIVEKGGKSLSRDDLGGVLRALDHTWAELGGMPLEHVTPDVVNAELGGSLRRIFGARAEKVSQVLSDM